MLVSPSMASSSHLISSHIHTYRLQAWLTHHNYSFFHLLSSCTTTCGYIRSLKIMEHPSKLEENLDALLTKLSHLKCLRDEAKTRGDHRMNRWLNDLEDCENEVNEIRTRLHELKSGFHPNKFNIRLNLNKKVIKTLNQLEVLEPEEDEDTESIQVFITEQKKGMPQQFSHEQLIGFTTNKRIGYGGFADVYKGEVNGVLVAIKVLRDSGGHVMKRQFMAEVSTMFMTSHRNLVKLHGYCYSPKFKALVYEYMENGSLDKILYNNQPGIQWEKLYEIAIQIAKGLSYLHDSCDVPIIHHDVKAANVLLDSHFSPKVTDFGLAKIYKSDNNHATQSQIGGTCIYAAPELLLGSRIVTYHCDIFSFGMMLFEVLQRKMIERGEEWFPWQVWENFEKGQLDKIILGCGIEENNKQKAYTLSIAALWCTQYKPFDRPPMSKVINHLEGILQFPPPPNPFPYNEPSIESNTSSVPARTSGPPYPLSLSVESPPSDKWLGEILPNLEPENQVLHQKALAISPTARTLLRRPKTTIILRTPKDGHTQSGETKVPLENQDLLVKCISQDLGFSGGIPVAACLVYKCLLHWRSFEVEKTSVFYCIIQTIRLFIEVQDNNDTLSYWLSNSSTLLVLLQRTPGATAAACLTPERRRASSSSLFARMSQGLQGSPQSCLFKQKLAACLENLYGTIRDNLKKEISPMLGLCIQAPRLSRTIIVKGVRSQTNYDIQEAILAHMQRIVKILNNYLRTLRANYVPSFLVGKVFTQIFSFIDVQLFNSLLLRRECCSFSNAVSVKYGLDELEQWCSSAIEEFAGSAWDELRHIRQAVGFLGIREKPKMTIFEITKELCPVITIQQLYRISTMYWDDKHGTHSVSSDVITSMRVQMTEEPNNGYSSSFLLDDDSSIPFSVEDLPKSMQQIDITDIDPPPLLRENSAFDFLSS